MNKSDDAVQFLVMCHVLQNALGKCRYLICEWQLNVRCMQVVESIADMLLDDVLQQSAAGETCMACLSLLILQRLLCL